MMTMTLSQAERHALETALREGESPLWLGKGRAASVSRKSGLLARLFGAKAVEAPAMLYAITPKRVLALPAEGGPAQEWFLMLGLIQAVHEQAGGSGDIIFDFEETGGQQIPRGLIGIPEVAQVRNLLNDAIDAAYNASPWSV